MLPFLPALLPELATDSRGFDDDDRDVSALVVATDVLRELAWLRSVDGEGERYPRTRASDILLMDCSENEVVVWYSSLNEVRFA